MYTTTSRPPPLKPWQTLTLLSCDFLTLCLVCLSASLMFSVLIPSAPTTSQPTLL